MYCLEARFYAKLFIMQKFIKCQSLQNDFVLLDWLTKNPSAINKTFKSKNWSKTVSKMCDRHLGIGADGVLIVYQNANKQLETKIFNADGSDGERCLNGLRCAAMYMLSVGAGFPRPSPNTISMGGHLTKFEYKNKDIITYVGGFNYQGIVEIKIDGKAIVGSKVDVGNPHFVVFDQCSEEWLGKHAKAIAKAAKFSKGVNIEFVNFNKNKKCYDILVHERGAGFTKACGTAGVAIMGTLYTLGKIKAKQQILLNMPGGILKTYITPAGEVVQQAPAELVFSGEWLS
jgi:diaminopimelate epimerase